MADPQDDENSHERDNGKNRYLRNEGFASCALVNANYCYQMSLWWWNTYLYNLHAQFPDQNCECVEQSAIGEDQCECCQNYGGLETRIDQMNSPRDCAESIYFRGTPWQGLPGEHSVSSKNHPDFISKGDLISGDEKGAYGDEDFGNHSNSVNDGYGNDDVDDDDDDDEGSDVEMEVDENFRKFLEQSERHRQEREQRKQELLEENGDYIEVGSVHLNTTTSAPTEQPGSKRKEEMSTLYGKHAYKIMALEASLQLNYNKQCDARQPVFWPSIPLRF